MKDKDFLDRLALAASSKTLYVLGCFGAPMTAANKKRYSANNDYNKSRAAMIEAASEDTFGFDCVCTIKAALWGWSADPAKIYGGAVYCSNGVPDVGENTIINMCSDVSTDFSKIVPGEMLWNDGHAGVYFGDGLAIECSPAWHNGVQYTAVANIGQKAGYASRRWTKHGKLPWVEYEKEDEEMAKTKTFIVNVYKPTEWEMGFSGNLEGKWPYVAKNLEKWAADTQADMVFNLTFFNMTGDRYTKNHALQHLYVTGVGQCGKLDGGTKERLRLQDGSNVAGWKVGVLDGVVMDKDVGSRRARNMLGILADGRVLSIQTTYGCTENETCVFAVNQACKRYGSELSLLLVQDAGGSTGCYSRMAKLLFAPEKEGTKGRPVPNVFWVRRKKNAPKIGRTLYKGLSGSDVMILQTALTGLEVDGIFGAATKKRLVEAQRALGVDDDGIAGPVTLKAMGLR